MILRPILRPIQRSAHRGPIPAVAVAALTAAFVLLAALPTAAQISLEHVTISDNTATVDTGGLLLLSGSDGGTDVVLENTLIGDNSAPEAPDCSRDVEFGVSSQGVNLLSIGDGGTFGEDCLTGPPDLVGTLPTPIDPLLGPLADNGGFTPTHAVLSGSPAINEAPDQGETDDQRGVPRPQGAGLEIGAFEFAPTDLLVTKVDSMDPVALGGSFSYTLAAENLGPAPALDVTLVDDLPAELTFASAVPSAGGSCVTPSVGDSGGTVTCTFAGPTVVGDSVSVVITVGVPADATPGAVVVNQGEASSADGDPVPDPNPNQAEEDTTLGLSSLTLTKVDSPDPVSRGGFLTYLVTATNLGPDPALDLVITDTLPAELAFVSATPSAGGACVTPAPAAMGGQVLCTFAGLTGVGEERTVTVEVEVPLALEVGAVVVNQATVAPAADVGAAVATAEPTTITANTLEIPTLGEWGMLLLGLLLATGGLWVLRRPW